MRREIDEINERAWLLRQEATQADFALALCKEAEDKAQSMDMPYTKGIVDSWRTQAEIQLFVHLDFALALKLATDAYSYYIKVDDTLGQVQTLHILGHAQDYLGEKEEALKSFTEQLEIARSIGNQDFLSKALNNLGVLYTHLEDYPQAISHMKKCLDVKLEADGDRRHALLMNNLCVCLRYINDLTQSLDYGQRALRLAQSIGSEHLEILATGNVGEVYMAMGNYENAEALFLKRLAMTENGYSEWRVHTLHNLGQLSNLTGSHSQAIHYLQEGIEIAEEFDLKSYLCLCHEELAKTYKFRDDYAQAYHHFEQFHHIKMSVIEAERTENLHRLEVLYRTQQAQQEAQIQRDLREQDRLYFERMNEMKSEFIHTTTHDLKNPLATILTSLYLLKRHGITSDERGTAITQRIERQVNHMRDLITDLLDLAHLESGRALQLDFQSITDVIRDTVSDLKPLAKEKDIDIYVHVPDESIMVCFDSLRIIQVLRNLLSNAIKYSASGGQVSVQVRKEAEQVTVSVSDNGLGIPTEAIPHIFERFYRVKGGAHDQVAGTGLGLSIVQTIIQQHAGTVWVESKLDHGSKFSFALPHPNMPQGVRAG